MTYDEVVKIWQRHPEVLNGNVKTWQDWEVLFGEMMVEGGCPSYEEVQAISQHFGVKNPMIPPPYDRYNLPPE